MEDLFLNFCNGSFSEIHIKLVPRKQQHSPLIWASLFLNSRLKFIYMKARQKNSRGNPNKTSN